jgi:hypothetical protein
MRTLAQQRPVHHPLFARVYARVGHLMDVEIADHRRRLLAGLTGRVLEVGAGNGLNFPHYPATVTQVLVVLCQVGDHGARQRTGPAGSSGSPSGTASAPIGQRVVPSETLWRLAAW